MNLQRRFNCSGSWLLFLLFSGLIFVAAVMIIFAANSSPAFPPIAYLAEKLHLSAGQPLPQGIIWNGRPYTFYVVSAKELPNGRYNVIIGAR